MRHPQVSCQLSSDTCTSFAEEKESSCGWVALASTAFSKKICRQDKTTRMSTRKKKQAMTIAEKEGGDEVPSWWWGWQICGLVGAQHFPRHPMSRRSAQHRPPHRSTLQLQWHPATHPPHLPRLDTTVCQHYFPLSFVVYCLSTLQVRGDIVLCQCGQLMKQATRAVLCCHSDRRRSRTETMCCATVFCR